MTSLRPLPSRRRILAAAALGTVSVALLAGCASGASGSDAIQFQTGFAAGSDQLAALTKIVHAYEKGHEGVRFDLIPSSPTYEQTIKVKLASHDAPDIWLTHGWSRDRYKPFLAPLQDESWNDDVNAQLDAAMRDESGAIYAFPVDTDVAGILYNADVLEEAGVDADSLTTWKAFDAALAAIAKSGVTPIVVSGKANGPAGNLADWIAPGQYTDDELAALRSGTFDKSLYRPVVDRIASWADKGYFNPDYTSATQDDMKRALGAGDAAFVFQQNQVATGALTSSPDARLGFLPVPSSTGDPYLIGGEMNAFGLSKTSPHLDELKDFLDYLAEPDNDAALAEAGGSPTGLTTATNDIGPVQASYDHWVVDEKTPLVPYFDRVWLPNGMWNTLVTTTDSVIAGQSTPAQATDQLATDFTSLFDGSKG